MINRVFDFTGDSEIKFICLLGTKTIKFWLQPQNYETDFNDFNTNEVGHLSQLIIT